MTTFEQLVELLLNKNLRISAAESCTGGMFSSEIVGVPGASSVLSSSFVTYSEKAKINLLGVSEATIDEFGIVSENTALEMARGAAKLSSSEVCVGITGFAGPAADASDDTAGTVCFGFYVNGKTVTSTKNFGDIGRNLVRELSVQYAALTLISLINRFGDTQ